MFPVVNDIKEIASTYKNIVVIEMNAGQYVGEIERMLKRAVKFVSIIGGQIDIKKLKEDIEWVLKDS